MLSVIAVLPLTFPDVGCCQAPAGRSIDTDCLLIKLDQADIGAKRNGIIDKIFARVGDELNATDPVFNLSTKQTSAQLSVARAEFDEAEAIAANTWSIGVAQAELDKSSKEDEMLQAVPRVPYLEQFRATKTKEKNTAELHAAESKKLEDQLHANVTQAALRVAEIAVEDAESAAPFTGTIVKQLKYEGEWAEQGDVILRMVRMDKLMLQGIVNVKDISPYKVTGAKATATFTFSGEEPVVLSDLVIVKSSPEIDLDGNYLVWTHVTNLRRSDLRNQPQWLLRPGMSGELRIVLSQPAQNE
jgi:multidrug efflux pump subunit AcrA (membrane-fusion protein)